MPFGNKKKASNEIFKKEVTLKNGTIAIIRSIQPQDVIGIWSNFNDVVAEGIYLPVYTPVFDDWEKQSWYKEMHQGNNFCIIAKIKNSLSSEQLDLAGQLTIEDIQWEAAEHVGQLGIIIHQNYRNLGLGNKMIKIAKVIAQKYGKKKLTLTTLSTNQVGIKLYEKLGFKAVGKFSKQYLIKNQYIDEILMECWLE